MQCQRVHLAAAPVTLRRRPAQSGTCSSLAHRDRLRLGLWQQLPLQPAFQIDVRHVAQTVPRHCERQSGEINSGLSQFPIHLGSRYPLWGLSLLAVNFLCHRFTAKSAHTKRSKSKADSRLVKHVIARYLPARIPIGLRDIHGLIFGC